MNQVIKVFFGHQANYYSAFVTIIHEFETDFIYIELLDEDMIETFEVHCLSYTSIKGYKNLPAYQSTYLRPILNRISNVIENAQYIISDQNAKTLLNDEFIRQN